MKTSKLFLTYAAGLFAAFSAQAQGTFQNLNFEAANLTPIPPNQGAVQVPITSALPAWTGYIGTDQITQVYQNTYGEGLAQIDIFGPNYPSAGPTFGPIPGTIDGNYSVLLQSDAIAGASIAQTGTIPPGSQFVEFKAWQTASTQFTVSFDGTSLTPVVFGSGTNYTLYGADVSPYAGQSGQLEFTADFSGTGASWLGLDDITFSTTPEPGTLALVVMGGLAFAVRRWRGRGS